MYDKWPRPLSERSKRIRKGFRGRDKVTGMADAKRNCPAYEGLISATTCRESRGVVEGCDARCPYFAPMLTRNRSLPGKTYPLHKCYFRYIPESGCGSVLVARHNPDGTLRVMSLLLDLWKRGLQDCFMDVSVEEAALEKHIQSFEEPPYEEKELQECQRYINWAEKISQEVGHEVPWEYRRWKETLGNMNEAPAMEGSLYRCAKCMADLPHQAVELMKQYALRDDVQFYLACRKCGGEFDEEW